MANVALTKAGEQLNKKVIQSQACTLCGGCVNMCPYLRVNPRSGIVQMLDSCNVEEGRCFAFCPRTGLDLDALNRAVFGKGYGSADIGEVRRVLMARSTDSEIKRRAQYGGTVTTLLSYMLDKKLLDAAVVTRTVDWAPEAVVVTNRVELLESSGSNYMACSTLEAFNKAASGPMKKIGVVGVPCQMQALAKRRASGITNGNDIGKLAVSIGLFCTWALDRSFLSYVKSKAPSAKVKKVDISPPPAREFNIYTSEGCLSIPLAEVREFVRPSCLSCVDMTAEYADISVGSVEGTDGWNTVIIRSEVGLKLFEEVQKTGAVETKPLPVESLKHLKEASLLKKKRALENIMKESGSKQDLGYLKIMPDVIQAILNGR